MSSGFSSLRSPAAPVVGILGGIGSGKTSVAESVEGLRLQILNADRIGHELLSDPEIASAIRVRFGTEIANANGEILRNKLAAEVFGTSDKHQTARRDLETILHPRIRQGLETEIHATPQEVDVIILDAALLLEAGWDAVCDSLIFIDTPEAMREERVVRDRAWPVGELQRREATQFTIGRKREAADFVVDNSGPIETAAKDMSRILHQIIKDAKTGPSRER